MNEYEVINSNSLPQASGEEIGSGEVLVITAGAVKRAPSVLMKGEPGDKLNFSDLTPENINELKSPAVQAAGLANEAAASASQQAAAAEQAAQVAGTKAGLAEQAATNASQQATAAQQAAQTAETKAGLAQQAATSASQQATAAQQAAQTAETKAGLADAAAGAATAAAQQAILAAEGVEDGKTPQLSAGEVATTTGSAAAYLRPDGTDESGNPKYILDFGIPRGETGFTPVFSTVQVTTLLPVEQATATLTPDGLSVTGAPRYRLELGIPRGASGQDGEGNGNAFITNFSELQFDKTYCLSPVENGDTQYVAREVDVDLSGKTIAFAYGSGDPENITSGETLPVLFGKVWKWFDKLAALGALAWKSTLNWAEIIGKPVFSTVAVSGNYYDLSNIPNIPENVSDLHNDADFITLEEVDSRIGAIDLTPYELAAKKVSISSLATEDEYPNAKSVFDMVQDVIATIPAGGLKIPLSLIQESDLPDLSEVSLGDYFVIQNMDESMPNHSGRAWVNFSDMNNPGGGLEYYIVYDQYGSGDGESIVQTGSGALKVSTSWLSGRINSALDGYVQQEAGKELYPAADKTKLAGIQAGAQVNVKPDWNADSGSVAEILNKPSISSLTSDQASLLEFQSGIYRGTTLSGIPTDRQTVFATISANATLEVCASRCSTLGVSLSSPNAGGWPYYGDYVIPGMYGFSLNSPPISNGQVTRTRVVFSTTMPNQVVVVGMRASSHASYGYGFIGKLDTNNTTYSSNYVARVSGTLSAVYYMQVPTVGSHFFEVGYQKTSATTANSDCCYYDVFDYEYATGDYASGPLQFRLKPGRTVQIFVQNTSASERTITLPQTATCISMSGTSKTIKGNGWLEIHVTSMSDGKYNIRVGEQE